MADETMWLIEPRDPLIVRDGRPFGPNPGARAHTLPFPYPSTIAGALRNKAGLNTHGVFERSQIDAVKQLGVRGPLLVELQDSDSLSDSITDWLIPAPADALLLSAEEPGVSDLQRRWLAPRRLAGGAETALPDGLYPVGPADLARGKVSTQAPRFWNWTSIAGWLTEPKDDSCSAADLGISRLAISTRTHVSIQEGSGTARERALFQTSGLELTWRDQSQDARSVFQPRRLALAATLEGSTPHFQGGLAPMGGERRLMRWVNCALQLPDCPEGLRAQIIADAQCRVLLLTPACFTAGYRPPINWARGGVTATVQGAAVTRAQAISGWDMAERRPKETRYLAPAGSVYYVKFAPGADIGAWFDATWMRNVSDEAQDMRDGFGLAAIGVWPQTLMDQEVTP